MFNAWCLSFVGRIKVDTRGKIRKGFAFSPRRTGPIVLLISKKGEISTLDIYTRIFRICILYFIHFPLSFSLSLYIYIYIYIFCPCLRWLTQFEPVHLKVSSSLPVINFGFYAVSPPKKTETSFFFPLSSKKEERSVAPLFVRIRGGRKEEGGKKNFTRGRILEISREERRDSKSGWNILKSGSRLGEGVNKRRESL